MGTPSFFIRLAGCNLRCPWCDTKYSWGEGKRVAVDEIVSEALKADVPHVVITGGEPLLQQKGLKRLIRELRGSGLSVQIESNATVKPVELTGLDFELTLSPKVTNDYFVADPKLVAEIVDEFNVIEIKLVIRAKEVINAVKFMREVEKLSERAKRVPLIIQPLHEGDYSKESREVVTAVLSNGYLRRRARVIPQLHKFLGIK